MRRASHLGRHRLIGTAAVMAIAAGIALATAGIAQASWTPTVTLTAHRWEGTSAAVAVNRYGSTVLAWSALNEDGKGCYQQIQLRMRSRSGGLGPIETLTPCGPPAVFPAAAIDDAGRAVVAWIPNATAGVQARRVSPAGKLGPLRTLSPKGEQVTTVSVAMAPNGEAIAIWVGLPSTGNTVVQARYIAANGALGPLRTLGSAQFQRPSVAVSRAGVATVAWSDGTFQRVVARRLTPARVSKLKVIMGSAGNTGYDVPVIADDSRGDTFFAVTQVDHIGNSQPTYLKVRQWLAGGRLGPVRSIARNDDTLVSDVALAADARGNSIVAWTRSSPASDVAFGRSVSRAGRLGPTVRLGAGYAPVITIDPAGAGLVAWQSTPLPLPGTGGNGLTRIFARQFAASSGRFGREFTLAANGDIISLGESWTGKIAAVWQQSTLPWPIRARFGP